MPEDTQLLKGILEGCVLSIVSSEENHGYRIVELLQSAGFSDVHEATVYPILTRLEKRGSLAYRREPSQLGPPRKVYWLTALGRADLSEFISQWNSVKRHVEGLIEEDHHE